MNRRTFFRAGAAGVISLQGLFPRLLAQRRSFEGAGAIGSFRRAPRLLERALSTRLVGFPTLQPVFGGVFLPGRASQLLSASSWNSFFSQIQTLAGSGYRLASVTAIQNNNTTAYYGAVEQASGNYLVLHTSDQNQFRQAFAQNQASYRLVDFAITWEQGQLYYVGYWLATSSPANQTLAFYADFKSLVNDWGSLSSQGNRMIRVQAFPQNDAASYTALYPPGNGGYALWGVDAGQFPNDVTNRFGGLTLAGLGYDLVNGAVVGAFLDKNDAAQFVWNQDWNTLSNTALQMSGQGLVLRAVTAFPDAPDFDSYFAANLAPYAMGYAWAVGKDGQIVAGGSGYARGPHESANARLAMTPDSRINLASVSKSITGIALEVLVGQRGISLDAPFWPFISSKVPNPDSGVRTITLRNLVTMYSGLPTPPNEGPLGPPPGGDIWCYLNSYLAQRLTGTPGVTYSYNNENFTILQAVIDQITGQDYVAWVTQNVLIPAGINPAIFSATPDPASSATLSYSGPADSQRGQYWSALGFVAPGGWISTARELLKILLALRNSTVLSSQAVSQMLNDRAGWYPTIGNFGTYYNHNGGLGNGANPPQQLNTVLVRLSEGYDLTLVANSRAPADVTGIAIGAFDSRGLLSSDLAIASVVHAAAYTPKLAPGAYGSIIGSGFTDLPPTDWSSSISGNNLPLSVGGISVKVRGQLVYVEYINPNQVNFLLPMNLPVGAANVELITTSGVGLAQATVEIDAVAPGLFTYTLNGVLYPAAVFASGPGVLYVAASGALPGYNSRPAMAGDLVELYATGCGQTTPPAPDGVVLTKVYNAVNPSAFRVTIGGVAATVLFAGLVSPGLFQINIRVPSGLRGGDQPLVLTVNNVASQPNVNITVLA